MTRFILPSMQSYHTLHPNASTLVSCTCMRGLLAALVLVASGWAVWSYVLRPALQPAPAPPPAASLPPPPPPPPPHPTSQGLPPFLVPVCFPPAGAGGFWGEFPGCR